MNNEILNQDVSKLMEFDASDYGNALSINHLYGDKFCVVKGWGLLYYNGKFWTSEGAESFLYMATINMMKLRGKLALDCEKEQIQKCVGTDNRRVNNAIQAFLKLPNLIKSVSNFNADNDLINVNNGVLNLRNLEFNDHSPDYNFTYCSQVNWNPDADTSFFLNWLSETLLGYENEAIREFFQMCLGYSLTGHTREEKIFYIHGKRRAGKGTLVDVLRAILGEQLAGATPFDTFTKKRDGSDQGFDLSPLHACRLVTTSESNKEAKMNEAQVKSITGNDPIRASFKGKDQFTFRPNWKIWAFSNFKPKGDVSDDAFWGRIIMFSFPFSKFGKEDTHLKDKLIQPENLEGAFLWMVQGAMKWFQQDRLIPPSEINNLVDEARDEIDIMKQWMDDNCIIEIGNNALTTPMRDLYVDFQNWCKDNGKPEWGENAFGDNMRRKQFTSGKAYFKPVPVNGYPAGKATQKRCYFGIAIRDNEKPF